MPDVTYRDKNGKIVSQKKKNKNLQDFHTSEKRKNYRSKLFKTDKFENEEILIKTLKFNIWLTKWCVNSVQPSFMSGT